MQLLPFLLEPELLLSFVQFQLCSLDVSPSLRADDTGIEGIHVFLGFERSLLARFMLVCTSWVAEIM